MTVGPNLNKTVTLADVKELEIISKIFLLSKKDKEILLDGTTYYRNEYDYFNTSFREGFDWCSENLGPCPRGVSSSARWFYCFGYFYFREAEDLTAFLLVCQ